MSQDFAILEAAFALRESGTASVDASQKLHDILPAKLSDVAEAARSSLSGEILKQLASDPHAMEFVAGHIAGTGTSYKSFGPPIPIVPAGASVYVCPVDGLYKWSRPDATYPIPNCPTHAGVMLVPKKPAP